MSAKFPTAIATDRDLSTQKDRAQSTLTGALSPSATSFTVVTGSKFQAGQIVTIDNEQILVYSVSGNTVNVGYSSEGNIDGRGWAGTSAASHVNGSLVSGNIVALSHNALADEVKAIEAALGTNLSNIPTVAYPIAVDKGGTNATTAAGARTSLSAAKSGANSDITSLSALSTPLSVPQGGTGAATNTGILQGNGTSAQTAVAASSELQYLRRKPNQGATPVYEFASPAWTNAADYNFTAQTPGGSLTGGISNTVTLSPVPAGVNGTNTNHWLYISGGTGTAEAVRITGGTAVSGSASGTVTFTPSNNHSGAWTISSATVGMSEAEWAGATAIELSAGAFTIHGPVNQRGGTPMQIRGAGKAVTILTVAADFPSSASGVFKYYLGGIISSTFEGGVSDMTIKFTQPDSANPADMIHYPPAIWHARSFHPVFERLTIVAAWDGIYNPDEITLGATIRDCDISAFNKAIRVAYSTDRVIIDGNYLTRYVGTTVNQQTAYAAASPLPMYFGQVDDLKATNNLLDNGSTSAYGMFFEIGPDGFATTGVLTNNWLDGNGGIFIRSGLLRFTDTHMAGGTSGGMSGIEVVGGRVTFDGLTLYMNTGSSGYGISYIPSNALATVFPDLEDGLWINNAAIWMYDRDISAIRGYSNLAGEHILSITNSTITRSAGIAYTQYNIVHGGDTTGTVIVRAHNNVFSDVGAGNRLGVITVTDHNHSFTNNQGLGASTWTYSLAGTANTIWQGNHNFASNYGNVLEATRIRAKLSPSTFVPLQTENYIASETGSNNAIAGALVDSTGTDVPLAAGLRVTVKLAHTLQAGANTFALNGGSAKDIKSSRNVANNIGTAYASTGIISMVYDGTRWLDMSQ